MLHDQRHEKILKQLDAKHAVKVTALAKELGISESTVRRDINELHEKGKLKRVFGGAVSMTGGRTSGETNVAERSQINVAGKERIARYAASLIEDNDFVYIDAGTTTAKMVDYLENRKATYVTNGLVHGKRLLERGFRAYIIGGQLRPSTEASLGVMAVEAIKQYNFTKCFMGANGVDLRKGFSTPDINEAAMKSTAIKQSYQSYILADFTKFGLISPVSFAKLEEANIITDREENQQFRQYTSVTEVLK